MRTMSWTLVSFVLAGSTSLAAVAAAQPPLTADQAVRMALERNSQIIAANAGLVSARGGLYSSYSAVLPNLSASLGRSGTWTKKSTGSSVFLGGVRENPRTDLDSYSTSPSLSGGWSIFRLSSFANLRAAQHALTAARMQQATSRSEVAFATRQQFYLVVQAVKQIGVATEALRVARDSEHLVRAKYEVGSVSRADVLQAQVHTSQAQLDSITAVHSLLVGRDELATLVGVEASKMADVDTSLSFTAHAYDEASLLREAEANRPDLQGARASLKSAQAGLRSANLNRLPYVTLNYGLDYRPRSNFKQTAFDTLNLITGRIGPLDTPLVTSGGSRRDLDYQVSVSLNLDLFTGFQTEAGIADARANLMRAQDAYNVLARNLSAQVHEAWLTYQQALTSEAVAEVSVASAVENLRLNQEKYRVGSATILDLITAESTLASAQSQLVGALAGIRVAEAGIDQARGRAE